MWCVCVCVCVCVCDNAKGEVVVGERTRGEKQKSRNEIETKPKAFCSSIRKYVKYYYIVNFDLIYIFVLSTHTSTIAFHVTK